MKKRYKTILTVVVVLGIVISFALLCTVAGFALLVPSIDDLSMFDKHSWCGRPDTCWTWGLLAIITHTKLSPEDDAYLNDFSYGFFSGDPE